MIGFFWGVTGSNLEPCLPVLLCIIIVWDFLAAASSSVTSGCLAVYLTIRIEVRIVKLLLIIQRAYRRRTHIVQQGLKPAGRLCYRPASLDKHYGTMI